MSSVTQVGGLVVVRNEEGRATHKVVARGLPPRQTARAALRAMTNNGLDLYARLVDIANGKPHVFRYEKDGREFESEVLVPSLDLQRQTAKDLLEFLHGKAVPQTELVAAEEQQQQMEQMAALSDEQLLAIISKKRKELAGDSDDTAPEAE